MPWQSHWKEKKDGGAKNKKYMEKGETFSNLSTPPTFPFSIQFMHKHTTRV
jgi:hypothetical protein